MDDNESTHAPAETVVPFARPVSSTSDRRYTEDQRDALQSLTQAITTAVRKAEWSPDGKDAAAIEDEEAFRSRFGFDANRAQREAVISFKQDCDVTDDEIKRLRNCGSLTLSLHSVTIYAPTWWAVFGGVQILVLALFASLPIVGIILGAQRSWWVPVATVCFEAVLIWLIIITRDQYITPHRIARRVKAQRGERETALEN